MIFKYNNVLRSIIILFQLHPLNGLKKLLLNGVIALPSKHPGNLAPILPHRKAIDKVILNIIHQGKLLPVRLQNNLNGINALILRRKIKFQYVKGVIEKCPQNGVLVGVGKEG
jgi:hypothetical protein